jgi:nucleotide-binding universal stress UspA family protein
MTDHDKPPVVVGVDGTDQSLNAVRFAVAEAVRMGCGLCLVHALPELADTAPIVPLAGFEIFDEVSQRIMQQAEQTARAASGDGLPLEKVIRTGTRVHVLVEASEEARLVVLGHRDRPAHERVLTGSTSTGVATRAHCPVVCVPTSWTGAPDHQRVVVGLEDPEHSHELLTRAFAAASARRARLRVLHAWRLQRPYDELAVESEAADSWTGQLHQRLRTALADLKSAFPEVDVDLDVVHEDAATALLAACQDADLLLLGRRGRGARLGFPLGSTARALLRESSCPVEITPLHPAHLDTTTPDLALTADELSPQT